MPKNINKVIVILICAAFMGTNLFSAETKFQFKKADAKKELQEFIKIHRRAITGQPNTEETKKALFGLGEYYYKHNSIYDARTSFKEYIKKYPPDISTFIARVFLLKIARLHNDADVIEKLIREIFDKPFIIIFSEYEQIEYTSTFGNKYIVHNYIDRVEVFLNGNLFEEIKP